MMPLDRSGAAPAAAALACVLALSCGGGDTPATSTPPTTTPSPSSTAGTGGGGTSAICSLGKGDVNAVCSSGKGSARLQLYVETAIDQLVREKPQLFDLNAEERPNTDTFRVLDTESYLDNMAINIRRQGACAERDPDDLRSQRILAKDTNDLLGELLGPVGEGVHPARQLGVRRDLHAGVVPDRPGRGRAPGGQRLPPPVPAARDPVQREDPRPVDPVLHDRLHPDRGPEPRVLPVARLHGRADPVPGPARGLGRPVGLRELARRHGPRHRPPRAHLDERRRQAVHRDRRAIA